MKEEETVVLSITDIQENGNVSETNRTQIDSEKFQDKPSPLIVSEPLGRVHEFGRQINASQASENYPSTIYHPVSIAQDFIMVQGAEGTLGSVKPGGVQVDYRNECNRGAGGGQMIIMLSSSQAPDPHLYFVMENGEQDTN